MREQFYTAMLGEKTPGPIAVLLHGEQVNEHLVTLACSTAKSAKRKVILIAVAVVPRSLPLATVRFPAADQADALLHNALKIAQKVGCAAKAETLHVREAAVAVVDEVQDQQCALLLIGWTRRGTGQNCNLGPILPYIQARATCQVWVVVDPPPQSDPRHP